ncbi:MAG: glycosyltransferase family 2 protein [Candidatus Stahlbacteria bacterium]|nr:glycosyltransferase family 2 protein [Candidatus Stahlbacteria bacterium]
MIKLSIIIVNWNVKHLLESCLASIYRFTKEIEFEIIVIDNNSPDRSVEMIKSKYPQVYLIENKENVGFAKASNQGIKVGKGDYFLLLNPDTIVHEESIDKMLNFILKRPDIGILGPKVLNPDQTIQLVCSGRVPTLSKVFLWQTFFKIDKNLDGSNPWYFTPFTTTEIDWVSGVCMMIRKEVFKQIGLMDENIFAYFEDVDFCYRARLKGWKVYYFNEAKITHLLAKSWTFFPSKIVTIKLESELIFFAKHYGKNVAFICMLLTAYGSLTRICIWSFFYLFNKKRAKKKLSEHKIILKSQFPAIKRFLSKNLHKYENSY